MTLDIWSEFKEQVRTNTDLVALVGETRTVTPKNGGREYRALCPFHDDHDPSLTIDPARQTYKCWACGEGGDCFSYLMKLEGLDFRATLEQLANRANLEMPKSSGRGNQRRGSKRQDILNVLAWASQRFYECLLNDPAAEAARDYLLDRGFCEEVWSDFQLGFQPGGWSWLLDQAKGKFPVEVLEEARLISPNKQGNGYFDFFRNRVMFPITDERGQVIAFGGRGMPGSEEEKYGKYQNSRDSALFNKSRQLYGIDHAKLAMREQKQVIVVEGYTDCIALHQQGITNVVATLGTALTEQHVALIRRFCQQVLLVFDGDTAGQNAAEKALPRILAHDVDLKLLALPEGMDPPEYLERHGLQEFQKLLQNAHDAWDFKLNHLTQKIGLDSDHARQQVSQEMLTLLTVAPNMAGSEREALLLNRLANRVGLRGQQEHVLRQQLATLRAKGTRIANQSSQPVSAPHDAGPMYEEEYDSRPNDIDAERDSATLPVQITRRELADQLLQSRLPRLTGLERDLLEIIIMLPECLTPVSERGVVEQIKHRIIGEILSECERLNQRDEWAGVDSLLSQIEDPELKRVLLAIRDQAEQKQIAEKLHELATDPEWTGVPAYLQQVIEQLNWEHKESQHRNSMRIVVVDHSEPTSIEDRLRQKLQDAAQFHQQRVTRKTASTQ